MADAERKEYQTVVLAALLHDIGKALMRGDFGSGLRIEGQHPQVWVFLTRLSNFALKGV